MTPVNPTNPPPINSTIWHTTEQGKTWGAFKGLRMLHGVLLCLLVESQSSDPNEHSKKYAIPVEQCEWMGHSDAIDLSLIFAPLGPPQAEHQAHPDLSDWLEWWAEHRASIVGMLPFKIGGFTYTVRFPECCDQWLGMAGDMRPSLASGEVLGNLIRVKRFMEDIE